MVSYPETETLGSLSDAEQAEIIKMLSIYGAQAGSAIREILLDPECIANIFEAVRAVKKRTNTEFKGAFARGNDLTLRLLMPGDILQGGTALTSWSASVSAGASWFESGAGDAPLTMDEYEARVYLGWADPVDEPLAIGAQIELDGDLQMGEVFYFDLTDANKAKVIKNTVPWQVRPLKRYRIRVVYEGSGSDRLIPIGVRIGRASVLLSL